MLKRIHVEEYFNPPSTLKIKIREKRIRYSKNSFYLLFSFVAFVIEKKKKERKKEKRKEKRGKNEILL